MVLSSSPPKPAPRTRIRFFIDCRINQSFAAITLRLTKDYYRKATPPQASLRLVGSWFSDAYFMTGESPAVNLQSSRRHAVKSCRVEFALLEKMEVALRGPKVEEDHLTKQWNTKKAMTVIAAPLTTQPKRFFSFGGPRPLINSVKLLASSVILPAVSNLPSQPEPGS